MPSSLVAVLARPLSFPFHCLVRRHPTRLPDGQHAEETAERRGSRAAQPGQRRRRPPQPIDSRAAVPLSLAVAAWSALALAPLAHASVESFAIDLDGIARISGTMKTEPEGNPTILSATYVNLEGVITGPVTLIGGDGPPLVSITPTRINRSGLVFVIRPTRFASLPALDDSFALMQWHVGEHDYYASLWTPIDVPYFFLIDPANDLSLCALAPDESDPLQTLIPLPGNMLLVVYENPEATPVMLDGYVFLEGEDGCWSLEYIPSDVGDNEIDKEVIPAMGTMPLVDQVDG